MNIRRDEMSAYALREMYRLYGYAWYRMGKFEEYELYARNKSFLRSERILTFTDVDGRLMAMKPDVTLSIVKNRSGERLEKLCYHETVLRADENGFRQIPQTGLECLGPVDDYLQSEVLMLACRSLQTVDADYLLDISHLGYITELAALAVPEERRGELLEAVERKNASAIRELCAKAGTEPALAEDLLALTAAYAAPEELLPKMRAAARTDAMEAACRELETVAEGVRGFLPEAKIRVDLSMLDDLHYYNGLIFRGMVAGVPFPVLSGGRYDSLLARMGKSGRAIGFAIYWDRLERSEREPESFDADALLLYGPDVPPCEAAAAVQELRGRGLSVLALPEAGGARTRYRFRMEKGEVVPDE